VKARFFQALTLTPTLSLGGRGGYSEGPFLRIHGRQIDRVTIDTDRLEVVVRGAGAEHVSGRDAVPMSITRTPRGASRMNPVA